MPIPTVLGRRMRGLSEGSWAIFGFGSMASLVWWWLCGLGTNERDEQCAHGIDIPASYGRATDIDRDWFPPSVVCRFASGATKSFGAVGVSGAIFWFLLALTAASLLLGLVNECFLAPAHRLRNSLLALAGTSTVSGLLYAHVAWQPAVALTVPALISAAGLATALTRRHRASASGTAPGPGVPHNGPSTSG